MIEPPVLVSRILTFVFATSFVSLVVLCVTLFKMIPIERPEVFFLFTPTRSANVRIVPMNPDGTNENILKYYKEGFVREYIIARNTLETGSKAAITYKNWSQVVKPWSSETVFNRFEKTDIYKNYIKSNKAPNVSCSVIFDDKEFLHEQHTDTYHVKITWLCENIGGQIPPKNYKIRIRIQSELEGSMSAVVGNIEKLRLNPLGIQVVDYIIEDGQKDPLDSVFVQ